MPVSTRTGVGLLLRSTQTTACCALPDACRRRRASVRAVRAAAALSVGSSRGNHLLAQCAASPRGGRCCRRLGRAAWRGLASIASRFAARRCAVCLLFSRQLSASAICADATPAATLAALAAALTTARASPRACACAPAEPATAGRRRPSACPCAAIRGSAGRKRSAVFGNAQHIVALLQHDFGVRGHARQQACGRDCRPRPRRCSSPRPDRRRPAGALG